MNPSNVNGQNQYHSTNLLDSFHTKKIVLKDIANHNDATGAKSSRVTLFLIESLFCRDEDMQSMASLMSTNNNSDIAPLDDFDEDDDGQYIVVRPIKKLNK